MKAISYSITAGSWSVNSADDPRTELVRFDVRTAMNTPVGGCELTVYAPAPSEPGLLDAAIGAASDAIGLGGDDAASSGPPVQVRGQDLKYNDPVSIELKVGDGNNKVMTAGLRGFQPTLDILSLRGRTALQELAQSRMSQVFENLSMKQIIEDMLGETGADAGEIETGTTYPYFVVDETKSAWRHILELARREAMDVYVDIDNKVQVKKFEQSGADHTLYFGIDVLDVRMDYNAAAAERVRVYGESPSSKQGADTWPWLAKDLSSFQSEVGEGGRLLAVQDGSLRTKDAADLRAAAIYGTIQDQAASGQLKLLGRPEIQLGDAIEVKEAPYPSLNGLFKVVSIHHQFSKSTGFITWIGFTGQGGADAAGGLLGAIGGLAGGLGL